MHSHWNALHIKIFFYLTLFWQHIDYYYYVIRKTYAYAYYMIYNLMNFDIYKYIFIYIH